MMASRKWLSLRHIFYHYGIEPIAHQNKFFEFNHFIFAVMDDSVMMLQYGKDAEYFTDVEALEQFIIRIAIENVVGS